MKNKSIFKLLGFLTLATVTAFTACKDKEEDDNHVHDTTDTTKPVITITSPSAMQMYNNGDTVKIMGMVTDASLHELLIKIIKDSDNSEMYSVAPTVHDLTSYTINAAWKSNVSDHTNATLVILAEDHSSNVASDSIHIHIMP